MTLTDIDRWWMDQVRNRAVMLWRGEQVDGQLFEWYRDDAGFKGVQRDLRNGDCSDGWLSIPDIAQINPTSIADAHA